MRKMVGAASSLEAIGYRTLWYRHYSRIVDLIELARGRL